MNIFRYLLFALLLGAVLVLSQSTTGPDAGSKAPDISGRTLSGRVIQSAELSGKTIVVEFWATWCPACVSSLPALQRFYEQHGDDPSLEVFAVHVPKGAVAPAIRNFCQKRGYSFPVILDSAAHLSMSFQIESIPTLVVIGPDGVVDRVKNGALGGSPDDAAARIKHWVDLASEPDT